MGLGDLRSVGSSPPPVRPVTAAARQTLVDLEIGLRTQRVPEPVIGAAMALVRSGLALAEAQAVADTLAEVRG